MGYYSRIESDDVTLKKEFVKQVKKDIDTCKKHSASYLSSSRDGEHPKFKILRESINITGDYVFWHIEEMMINDEDNYNIYWEDDSKFYGDKDLVNYLKEKVNAGDIFFFGEDGENWGYRFDGQGDYKEMYQEWRTK